MFFCRSIVFLFAISLGLSVAFAQQLIQGPMMKYPRAPGSSAYPGGRPGGQGVREISVFVNESPGPSSSAGRCWGLLFAVEDYDLESQELAPLSGCFNDMDAARTEWFLAQGIPEERIVFLHDHTAEESVQPTKENFEQNLDSILSKLAPQDTLYVLVSSHGIASQGKSFLCPIDTGKADFLDVDSLEKAVAFGETNNLIPVAELITTLKNARCARKLLIIDACRNVGFGSEETRTSEDFMEEFKTIANALYDPKASASLGGLAVITSCSLGQQAHEMIVEDRYHGVFMKHFLEGLNGPADYSGVIDGEITLAEAYAYAFAQTNKFVYYCRGRSQQTPEIFRSARLTGFSLAKTEPLTKTDQETDGQFLLRQSVPLSRNGRLPLAVDLLSYVIRVEPNNHLALTFRAGAFLALGAYQPAQRDFRQLGRTLDLFVKFSEDDKARFQRQATNRDVSKLRVRIFTDPNERAAVKSELVPGQKVSISEVAGDGRWFRVGQVDDKTTGSEIGWIRKDNLTWSADGIEDYRPATPMFTPRVSTNAGRELSGEGRSRSSVGRAVGRQGYVVKP